MLLRQTGDLFGRVTRRVKRGQLDPLIAQGSEDPHAAIELGERRDRLIKEEAESHRVAPPHAGIVGFGAVSCLKNTGRAVILQVLEFSFLVVTVPELLAEMQRTGYSEA